MKRTRGSTAGNREQRSRPFSTHRRTGAKQNMTRAKGSKMSAAYEQREPEFSDEEFLPIKSHVASAWVVVVAIVIGLMVESTSWMSSVFIELHYKQYTNEMYQSLWKTYYGTGVMDLFTVFFYFLVWIILYSLVQDFVLDNICYQLYLSRSRKSKFIKYGQLIVFNASSIIWAFIIIIIENWFVNYSSLLTGYPDITMPFLIKLFYIAQLAFWADSIPELYFRKLKKKEMFSQFKYSVLNLVFVLAIYISNLYRIGILVLCIHNIFEFTKHVAKLIDITERKEDSKKVHLARSVYNWLFFAIQLLVLIVSQTTMCYLGLNSVVFSEELHDYKTILFKILSLISPLISHAWIVCKFSSVQKLSDLRIPELLYLFKPKLNVAAVKDSSNNKHKIAANQKMYVPTKAVPNVKKTMKNGVKKSTKI